MSHVPKEKLEQQWVDHLMLSSRDWPTCRSTHRFYLQEGAELVVYDEHLQARALWSVQDIRLSSTAGVSFALGEIRISSHPTKLAPSLYIWVPAFADVRWAPETYADPTSPRRLTFPVCIKTATNPTLGLKSGAFYLAERQVFLSLGGAL